MINNASPTGSHHLRIITAIKDLLGRDWEVTISHVLREANHCADWLATHFDSFDLGLHILEEAPHQISSYLTADAIGVSWPRARLAV